MVEQGNFHSGDDGTGGVGDNAVNAASAGLGEGTYRAEEKNCGREKSASCGTASKFGSSFRLQNWLTFKRFNINNECQSRGNCFRCQGKNLGEAHSPNRMSGVGSRHSTRGAQGRKVGSAKIRSRNFARTFCDSGASLKKSETVDTEQAPARPMSSKVT